MKMKWWRLLGGLIFGLLMMWGTSQFVAQAKTTTPKVMLVYDSQNVAQHDQTKVAAVQRLLTSFNVRVKTVLAADYHAGSLQHYQGVITMINWPQTDLNNAAFSRDRQRFKGIKLHIGPNLTGQ